MGKIFKDENELFILEDVAKELNIHIVTAQRYVREGKLKATKVGRRYLISKKNLVEFING